MYLLLFLIGAIGFLAMTVLGFSHGFGAHHIGGSAHSAGAVHHGAGSIGSHSSGHATHSAAHVHGSHSSGKQGRIESGGSQRMLWLLTAISPLDLFALALGAGATGELLRRLVNAPDLVWLAILGAIVFDLLIVKPLMSMLARFASKPSEGLEGTVATVGQATTNFDATGQGIVKIELDGQIIQLLATLDPAEMDRGTKVVKGEPIVVIQVDAARNTCVVSRELAPSLAADASIFSSQARSKTTPNAEF